MRIFLPFALLTLGALLILTGLAGTRSLAQEDSPPPVVPMAEREYMGAEECSACHRDLGRPHAESRHARALISPSDNPDFVLASFESGADVRTVTFPESSESRPFTLDDIAFALGSGRYLQRYLYAAEDGSYRLFPAEWNSVAGAWQAYTPDNAAPADWLTDSAFDATACIACHTTGFNLEERSWVDAGVQCEACHGPGSYHVELADTLPRRASEEDLAAVRGAILISADAQVCGQCHSSGQSAAGEFPFPISYRPGDTLTDTLTLSAPDDAAHWFASGHASQPNMQYNEWSISGHAAALEDLRAHENAEDTCLACHSADYTWTQARIALVEAGDYDAPAPDPITLTTAQFGVTCTSCHNPHAEPETAYNLRGESVYELCTACHSDPDFSDGIHFPVQQIYEGQSFIEEVPGVAGSHFTAEDGPDCQTCHMPQVPVEGFTRASHTMNIVMPGDGDSEAGLLDSCTGCHAEQASPDAMRALIEDTQAGTQARIAAIEAALTGDEPEWVGTALAFLKADQSHGVHNYLYTDALLRALEAEVLAQ